MKKKINPSKIVGSSGKMSKEPESLVPITCLTTILLSQIDKAVTQKILLSSTPVATMLTSWNFFSGKQFLLRNIFLCLASFFAYGWMPWPVLRHWWQLPIMLLVCASVPLKMLLLKTPIFLSWRYQRQQKIIPLQ